MPAIRALFVAVLACCLGAGGGIAEELGYRVVSKKAKYEDIRDNVQDAIIKRGFVVDYIGRFNAMLERTAQDTGSVTGTGLKSPYKNAEYLQFCPAKLTHEAVSATLYSIANCPTAIFVFEPVFEAGTIYVGFRLPVSSPSKRVKEVNAKYIALLNEIAAEATK